MAYIGRPLQVANLAVQSGTGDGSDTTPIATLDYATTTNGIAVYLDGVRQLAGTDYNVTSQTTLTFTTAPANGVGVDVYFLGLELSLPTPADATVAKAKITTTLINEHVDTVITAADSILFSDATDSNANKKDTVQGILDLATVSGLTNSSNATWMTVSADEEVNMPLQPCFLARPSSDSAGVTGTGNTYTVVLATEEFDVGSNFASNTFTAPITGKYLLTFHLHGYNISAAADTLDMRIVTSNRSYAVNDSHTNDLTNEHSKSLAVVADMDASDTAHCTFSVSGEASNVVIVQSGSGRTYFSGCLIA